MDVDDVTDNAFNLYYADRMESELATLRAENDSAQKSIRLIEMYIENGEPHSALRVAKDALK